MPSVTILWEDGTRSPAVLPIPELVPEAVLAVALSDFSGAPERDVPVFALRATQDALEARSVRAMVRAMGRGESMAHAPILVVEYGAARYVRDGHHRLAARCIAGEPTIRARVLALDPA